GSFGEELADEAVEVFVAASLPGRVGVAEVDVGAGGDTELEVLGEFGSLVPGEGPQQVLGELAHGGCEAFGDVGGGLVLDSDQQPVSAGAFHHRRHRRLAAGTQDQVAFPVAGNRPVFHLGGTL